MQPVAAQLLDGELMDSLLQDVRYALRLLRNAPGFAIAALLTLALAMGVNTMMFSVLNTVLLRPLPYPHSERLVQIWETDPHNHVDRGPVSPYNFLEWRKHSRSFSDIATYDYNTAILNGLKTPQRISTQLVSADFFAVFQVNPVNGRTFRPDEDKTGDDHVVVLSYGAWSRYFDRDPNIVGKSIALDDQPYSIIGIMPADFAFPNERVEAWCIPGFDIKRARRGNHFLFSVGRLKPGVSLEQARAEMDTIAGNLNRQDARSTGVHLVGLQDEIVGNVRHRLLVLWAAVLTVLLIACGNIAGLLLARAVSRQKEVAIRIALGGSRRRLIRQFLTESVLLAILGGILGIALSYATGNFLIAGTNGTVARLHDLQIDGWVLGITVLACIGTGLSFGIAPAIYALRFDLHTSMKESGAATQASDRLRLHSFFVIVELALAMVLLIAGGLLTRTLWRLQQVNPGFQAENIVTFRFSVRNGKYNSLQRAHLYQRLLDQLSTIPGVASVGATNDLPFGGSRSGESFAIEGRVLAPGETPQSDYRTVSPDYIQTMHIRLRAGREFTAADGREAPYVAIVNQAFVKRFFAGEQPLGKRLKIKNDVYEIVGVIADVKHANLAVPGDPEMYVPYAQADPSNSTFIVVRSQVDIQTLAPTIRSAAHEIAPNEPIYRLNTMVRLLENSISPQRFISLLLAVLAGLAVVLAAIGIYGVVAYSVVQRTREIGIRMALGADKSSVLRLVLRQGAQIGVLGVIGGTVAAWLATRMLSSMLFGVDAHDPATFLGVAASLILVVILATYVPARRATGVNPLMALRYE
jgi:putative ABC transport system permease protein